MPYITCIVASCKTKRKPNDKSAAAKCFSFPKDPILKKEWLELCKVQELDQVRDSTRKVCIKHFKEDDFVDGLKARLLNLQPRILKKDAVPSLFLNHGSENEENSKVQLKNQEDMLQKLLEVNKPEVKKDSKTRKSSSKEYLSKLVPIAPKAPIIAPQGPSERRQYAKFFEKHGNSIIKPKVKEVLYEHRFKILQHDNTIFKKRISELLNNQDKLKLRIKELEAKIKSDKEDFVGKVKEVFGKVLTPNQIDMVMGKKARAWWTDVEYAKAYTLQHLSKQAYFYVRETLNYPLPAFTSLQHWAAKLGAELPMNDDDENIPPLPKHLRLKLEKIKKLGNENNMDCVSKNNPMNDDIEADDHKVEQEEIYSDEELAKSEGEYNINIEVDIENDDNNLHEGLTYVQNDFLDENDTTKDDGDEHENVLDDIPEQSADSNNGLDDYDNEFEEADYLMEEIDEGANEIDQNSDEFYEELIVDHSSVHDIIDNLNDDKSSVIEEDNG